MSCHWLHCLLEVYVAQSQAYEMTLTQKKPLSVSITREGGFDSFSVGFCFYAGGFLSPFFSFCDADSCNFDACPFSISSVAVQWLFMWFYGCCSQYGEYLKMGFITRRYSQGARSRGLRIILTTWGPLSCAEIWWILAAWFELGILLGKCW